MIQFNLLPDVKKEYVKARRTKRLITNISVLSSLIAVGIVVAMYSFVNIAQKKHITDLGKDIDSLTTEIKSTKDLDKILTTQNQLSLLPSLHEGKPELSRVFDFITFATPEKAKVSSLDVDVNLTKITMAGTADSIATVNKFVDNLKAVRVAVTTDKENTTQTYSDVITTLSGDNDSATFKISLTYDPVIFDNTVEIIMSIGSQTISTGTEGG